MRYKCTVQYDGTLFHGFQTQPNLRTVQEEIEKVLYIITKDNIKIQAAGRTDTGVHSLGQVFHFDSSITMGEWNMQNALNSRLPKDIYISKVEHVDKTFHARYSAKKKEYHYIIDIGEYNPLYHNYRYYVKHQLDINKMIDASLCFIGEHDFKAFTKNHNLINTTRIIDNIIFIQNDNIIIIKFIGNGFLHNMIRIIVAMLIEVGRGRKTKEELIEILEGKDRTRAPKTAPPNGLYLINICYNI